MKRIRLILLVGSLLLVGCQSAPSDHAALYEALGERDGIEAITETMLYRIVDDERLADPFKGIDVAEFHRQFSDQICAISNGPCTYSGRTMREAHRDMNISKTQFNAVVEHLVRAMEKHDVSTSARNRLLGLLAPMHDDIVAR